jgi:addiction module HigA family antidote
MAKKMKPIHPGEILLEDFLIPMEITKYRLAKDINVPPTRIGDIVSGKRDITADTALRLSRYFGMSRDFWINLQKRYDMDKAEDALGKKLDKEVKQRKAVTT